jgi:hypothetical protein
LALLVICGFPALADTNYSKTTELPPLRVSFAELQSALDKGSSLMNAANSSASAWREELELRKGELRVKMSGHRLDPEGAKIPQSLDFFEYTALTRDPAPITRLALSFADYRRSLSVEGQSPEQVDAVFSALREDFSRLSTPVGGFTLRTFLGLPAIWLLVVVLGGLAAAWALTHRRILLLPVSICALLLTALLLLPLADLLAGFSAVRGDASFIVRYGPEISFWALVVGACAIPLSLLPLLSRTAPKADEAAPNSRPEVVRQEVGQGF